MKNLKLFLQKIGVPVFCLIVVLSFAGIASAASPVVSGAVKQGGNVSATPISIPRPIRLEKMTNFQPLNNTQTQQMSMQPQGSIDICDLMSVKGNQMTVSLKYRLVPSVKGPVYAGAFLYTAQQEAVDAGYKPVAVPMLPDGSVTVELGLPSSPFQSQYIMTFLIRSGKVIVNQRFNLSFLWDGQKGKMLDKAQIMAEKNNINAVLQNKAKFCDDYAKEALQQYEFGMKHHLPGIVPPVWSNDYNSHYNWCMKVRDKQAIQGSNYRKDHLKKHASPDTPGLPELLKVSPSALPGKPLLKEKGTMKSMPNKGLDPGRGP